VTLQHKLAEGRARLVAAGISEPEAAVDVELYARTILGWDRARLLVDRAGPVPDTLEPRFSEWLARRERREPSAYIVGTREFWGLDFAVTPSVLIPRPETEFIIEEALAIVGSGGLPAQRQVRGPSGARRLRVADIGTGSGCLAVTIAGELPECRVVASDVSAHALVVAQANARRHAVVDRITFVRTSYLDGVAVSFDLIVSNPPYVRDGDKPALSRDVRHEPDLALFGGADGLRDIEGVLRAAVRHLEPGGWFVMEFGYGQDDAVRDLVATRAELRLERIRNDLQDIPRTAIIRRQ
jgi:release factor glutamine methyltransferase